MKKRPFEKLKSFLASFISKIKTADIFNFLSAKYFGKGLLFLKIGHIIVKYCWSYESPNLLFLFFRYRLGRLDNRQTKIAENLKINVFESWNENKCLLKFSSFSSNPLQYDSPLNFFAKLKRDYILMANFSKIHKYQTLGLI